MARKKISSPEERGGIEHYLNEELWQIILEYTDQLPQESRREAAEYNRLRYIMRLFYFTGGRITELASACMGDFYMRDNNWWLKIKGKCNRIERIPAHKEMIEALQVYRSSHGFTDLPARNEKTPLIMALFQQRRVGVNMIYRIIKKHFQDIAAVIKTKHPNYAYTLQSATPHWIRHTAISHLTNKNVKPQHVQKFARHSNANSTAKYQHFEEVCWHKATQILGS
ncbi:site-specific integrase [Endozoicomonas sp. Mp262]|uniref:tyrosine-type recombinase/integrase n=1 Tax=Endozoicomonas sp. Mp262 TaxID=2919499 RepID=UPI0021DA2817